MEMMMVMINHFVDLEFNPIRSNAIENNFDAKHNFDLSIISLAETVKNKWMNRYLPTHSNLKTKLVQITISIILFS